MITFTALSGAVDSEYTKPLAYLLQVDDVRILLDCGSPDWNPEPQHIDKNPETGELSYRWETYCSALREHAPTIDLVLLSHGDLGHLGLYPYAHARWNLKAPTYATLPVQAMGRIAVTEDVEGIRDEEDAGGAVEENAPLSEDAEEPPSTPPPKPVDKGKYIATAVEVHDAFGYINTMRYSQPIHLQGKCQGLTITPFNAGHTLGGTIWKIRSPSSGTIVYGVNMNHMRERHLDGTVLMRQAAGGVYEPLARPDLFITDGDRASVITSRRRDRDASLIDTITATLSSRSSLLLPCDSSTRVLELLVLLDQHWNYSRLRYPICLLSRTGREMLTFVRSMMEWLGGTVSKEDVGEEGNARRETKRKRDEEGEEDALGALALRFKHLEFFPNPQALLQRYSSKDPKLILAVPASLSHGPSRNLFCDFAAVPDNVVLLTGRGEDGTLGRDLFNKWNDYQRADDKWDKGKIGSNVMMDGVLTLRMNQKVPLQGGELEAFLQKEKAAKEKEAAQQAAFARNQRMLEADEDESDSDSDSDADDEDEVRQALSGDIMDTGDDGDAPVTNGKRKKAEKDAENADWLDGDEGLTKQLLSFDIYLKGNVSKATSFFKTVGGQAQRFRMFPYVEKKRKVDDYGETIDVGMWLRKGKVFEEDAETDETKEAKRKQAEEDSKKIQREPPFKFISTEVEIQLACRLLFVDMEGLNDGRAVKTIIPQVNPRKMIIVHASNDSAKVLVDSCANIRSMTKDIYTPRLNESIQIGQQTNSFSIMISDEVLASVKMSRFEDNEVGYVTGRVVAHANSTIPTLEALTIANEARDSPSPADLPVRQTILGSRPAATLPHSTMIGELKLTALKNRLASIGIQAELIGEGVLICGSGARGNSSESLDETVAVRKTARGKVELEGNVSEVYYTVRREIYNLHALVAA